MVEPAKSWPEIRRDATRFAKEWRLAYDEKSQAQNFLVKFFEVFGIAVNQVATFESDAKRVAHLFELYAAATAER
jgi:hypothetical protein